MTTINKVRGYWLALFSLLLTIHIQYASAESFDVTTDIFGHSDTSSCDADFGTEQVKTRNRGDCRETVSTSTITLTCEEISLTVKTRRLRCVNMRTGDACGPFWSGFINGRFHAGFISSSSQQITSDGTNTFTNVTNITDVMYPTPGTYGESSPHQRHYKRCW